MRFHDTYAPSEWMRRLFTAIDIFHPFFTRYLSPHPPPRLFAFQAKDKIALNYDRLLHFTQAYVEATAKDEAEHETVAKGAWIELKAQVGGRAAACGDLYVTRFSGCGVLPLCLAILSRFVSQRARVGRWKQASLRLTAWRHWSNSMPVAPTLPNLR